MVKPEKQQTVRFDEFRRMMQGQMPKANRKVLNAAKTEQNGVVFASGIERFMHEQLKMHKIPFVFQKRYVLQEAFVYDGERVLEIGYTTDFWLPDDDMIIDTKGVQTQQGVVRIKMLKYQFALAGLKTRIELPSTKDECTALVRRLLEKRQRYGIQGI